MTARGRAPVPAPGHPAWCDRRGCTVAGERGEHRSAPAAAGDPVRALADIRLWLEAVPEDGSGPAYVLLDIRQCGERRVVLLGLGQAAELGRQLGHLTTMAAPR